MRDKSERKTITLAIEHSERELVPKILLAKTLANSGWRVLLGSTEAVDEWLKFANPSVVFHKSTFNARSAQYKQLGHKFCFLDEEGGPATPESQFIDFCNERYSTISPLRQDIVFFPSSKYIQQVRKIVDSSGLKLVASGWIRSDLWRPEMAHYFQNDVREIKRKHGKFFLFPSSFGGLTDRRWAQIIDQDPSEQSRSIQRYRRSRVHDHLDLLIEMRAKLQPEEKIVIRPHPSEDIHAWRKILSEDSQVAIIRRGDVTPWMIAAEGILTFGSTTAIQALVMGKKTVQYKLKKQLGVTDSLAFSKVKSVESAEDVLAELRKPNSSHKGKELDSSIVQELNINPKKMTSEIICEELSSLDIPRSQLVSLSPKQRIKLTLLHFGSSIKSLVRGTLRLNGEQTISEKIPGGITAALVLEEINKMGLSASGESRLTCESLAKNLVVLELNSPHLGHQ